jgi:lipoprotein-anchoring transpeptidase ErfK/SrfK
MTPSQPTLPHNFGDLNQPDAAQDTIPARPVREDPTAHRPPLSAAPTMAGSPLVRPPQPAVPTLAHTPVRHLPQRRAPQAAAPRRKGGRGFLLWIAAAAALFVLASCMASALGVMIVYNNGILPGVRVAGVDLGGMAESEAAAALAARWSSVMLADADSGRTFSVEPQTFGLMLDAAASAARAYDQGRGAGDFISALRGVDVAPAVSLDLEAALAGLATLRAEFEIPAVNAGVQFVNGAVAERPATPGRALDLEATAAAWRDHLEAMLAGGVLPLVMREVAPQVTSAQGMVDAARALLANPFSLRAFDPVTGDQVYWNAQPETWAAWLLAESDPASATGLRLTLDTEQARAFVSGTADSVLDDSRYIDADAVVADMQAALAANRTSADVRVYHHDGMHTVQPGETIISIAWDYGVPYPWVQQANGGIENVSIGQQIVIPSPDNFLYFDPVPDKRVEVSISQQRVRVYENGALKWDWGASTGINSSPTWPGLYQIISHVPNAYAANWNLWMPNFLGVYQPIPGSEFTNGFHGFPTRGGGQILWENSIGTRVTYGCILLSNTNSQLLYDWAEDGVVVRILP